MHKPVLVHGQRCFPWTLSLTELESSCHSDLCFPAAGQARARHVSMRLSICPCFWCWPIFICFFLPGVSLRWHLKEPAPNLPSSMLHPPKVVSPRKKGTWPRRSLGDERTWWSRRCWGIWVWGREGLGGGGSVVLAPSATQWAVSPDSCFQGAPQSASLC